MEYGATVVRSRNDGASIRYGRFPNIYLYASDILKGMEVPVLYTHGKCLNTHPRPLTSRYSLRLPPRSPHRRQGRLVRLGQRTHSTVVDLIRDSDQSEDYLFAYATCARVELEGQLWVKMDQAIVDRLQVEVDLFQTAISRLQDLKVKVSKGVGLSDSINSLNTLLLSSKSSLDMTRKSILYLTIQEVASKPCLTV